jgi:hypothetical protein
MYNLYLRHREHKLITAAEKPFRTEAEFEEYLLKTKEIFSDIFILKRQVHAGRDIPDMIGIDRDNNIVIIENKNAAITEDILPQIMRYAVWAETNPDSIRAMWLEAENRPEDIDVEWENVDIRIIVLAPSIKLSVPRLLKKINYNVELIEVKRFVLGNDECILLNKLEEEPESRTRPVHGREDYGRDFYKQYMNSKSVDLFFQVVGDIERLVERRGWNLQRKFNKYYAGFKAGFPNVFGVNWVGSKSFGFFFKVSAAQFSRVKKLSPYPMEYDERWKQATVRYDEKMKVRKLEKVFAEVYRLFMEKSA